MCTVLTEYRYITSTPEVCGGRPVIRGTRTPVQTIVGYYKLGLSVEETLEGFRTNGKLELRKVAC